VIGKLQTMEKFMSSISAANPVTSNVYVHSTKPAAVTPNQPAPAAVKSVGSDSDGDNDGSKGQTINTKA